MNKPPVPNGPVTLEQMKEIIQASPFNRYLGFEILEFNNGKVEVSLPIRPELTQFHGYAHGAVVGAVADVACAWAAVSIRGNVVTGEYKINFCGASRRRTFGRARPGPEIFSPTGSLPIRCICRGSRGRKTRGHGSGHHRSPWVEEPCRTPDSTGPKEPQDKNAFTRHYDREYTRFAKLYDLAVRHLPIWKRWIGRALPYLKGPRVLEASFGTGYLIGRYAHRFEAVGLDYNQAMVDIARQNLKRLGKTAMLVRGDVGSLPFKDECFDTVLCTMAFSGYPDGNQAMEQIRRVLKPDGRLVVVDINYPSGPQSVWVCLLRACGKKGGDIIRDMDDLFTRHNFDYTKETYRRLWRRATVCGFESDTLLNGFILPHRPECIRRRVQHGPDRAAFGLVNKKRRTGQGILIHGQEVGQPLGQHQIGLGYQGHEFRRYLLPVHSSPATRVRHFIKLIRHAGSRQIIPWSDHSWPDAP